MRIATIDPTRDASAVDGIIKVYQAAFGGWPWNEGWKCAACEKTLPLDSELARCPACWGEMQACWPAEVVRADFMAEMRKPNARCCAAMEGEEVTGVAWRYDLLIVAGTAERLEAPDMKTESRLFGHTVIYLDEIFVAPDHQKRGIGTQLFKEIRGAGPLLLRTRENSPVIKMTKNFGGDILCKATKDRVIMLIP